MQSRLVRLLAALLALSLLAAACGDDDDPIADDTADDDAANDPGTIVDIAAGNDDFSILVAAVTEAGLVDTLSSEGPFTVFAPTDAAFEAAIEALGTTAEELLARDDLGDILTYHVVSGAVFSTDLSDAMTAPTVNGAEITIGVSDAGVTVNDANVVTADLEASNGVIHVIDAVLLPPAA